MFVKQLRLFILITPLVFMISLLHAAPSGKILGYVFDSQSKDPLPSANVYIEGTGFGSATDLDGSFVITDIPPGDYKLVVVYIGYREKSIDISLEANQTLKEAIELDFQSIEGEVVVVTAQAEGQMQAINQQLASNTISNVVSKSRIKELPDVNAAESIGRLPGISIERYGGEATKVSIRGLSAKYNTVTVNGVRLPSTGLNDRSSDLSLISSNMLDGIEVKKAITPDMDADVLGGTVDLKLREAPANLAFNAQAQWGYNKLQDYYGNYNFTGNLSNRYYDNRLGFIASFNFDNYDRSADKFQGEYREQSTAAGETEIVVNNLRLREDYVNRERSGGSIVLDYRIPNGKIIGNSFYNRLSWDGLYRINRMDVNANRHYYELEDRGGVTQIFTGSLGMKQDFDWIRYDISGAWTASRTKNPNERTWQFVQEYEAFTDTDFPPGTDPKDIVATATNDTFETALAEVWVYDTNREENQQFLELNLEIPFRLSNQINGYLKTGGKLRWLDRMNDVERIGRNGLQYGNQSGPNGILVALDKGVPEWGVEELVDEHGILPISIFLDNHESTRANFLDGEYRLGFSADQAMMNTVTDVLSISTDNSGPIFKHMSIGSLQEDYDGVERYQAGYVMADINFGKDISFLPGIRYERDYSQYHGHVFREVTVNNIQGPPADLDTITTIRTHEFWLPMAHIRWQPTGWLKIRLAYTETLTRPDFIHYAPITHINSYQTYMRAANSLLRPAQSTNYDASFSIYQNHVGFFTVAGFYKDVTDLIFQTRYIFKRGVPVPEGFNIPAGWLINTAPEADIYINNEHKATYQGFELDWQTHFWYLPSIFKGMVLNVNYTLIDSKTEKTLYFTVEDSLIRIRPPVYSYKVIDSTRAARMPDQPAHIANVTLGYDYKGFSARLSFLYQTDKVTFIDREPVLDRFTGAYARWDLAVWQSLGRGLQLFANFVNLNNRPDQNFRGVDMRDPTYIEYYGFTMDVGIRYRF
jgi:TonB-dependent receptor